MESVDEMAATPRVQGRGCNGVDTLHQVPECVKGQGSLDQLS